MKSGGMLGVRGFTIVELLVVIVVIAILASVSVAAFNGVSERAKNASVISAVNDWSQVFKIYKQEKGALPLSSYSCVGNATSNFPANGTYSANACTHGFPYQPNYEETYSETYLGTDIKSTVSVYMTVPNGATAEVKGTKSGTQIYSRGITYKNGGKFWYYLYGKDADCKPGTATSSSNGDTITLCELYL